MAISRGGGPTPSARASALRGGIRGSLGIGGSSASSMSKGNLRAGRFSMGAKGFRKQLGLVLELNLQAGDLFLQHVDDLQWGLILSRRLSPLPGRGASTPTAPTVADKDPSRSPSVTYGKRDRHSGGRTAPIRR